MNDEMNLKINGRRSFIIFFLPQNKLNAKNQIIMYTYNNSGHLNDVRINT